MLASTLPRDCVVLERSSSKRRRALPAVATRGLGAGSPHLSEQIPLELSAVVSGEILDSVCQVHLVKLSIAEV